MDIPTEQIRVSATVYNVEVLTIEMSELVIQIDKTKARISADIVQIQMEQSTLSDLQTKLLLCYVKETGRLPPT